ncbi:hypothetical protein A605_12825 [Corynebacterium halotolerans YIM 70093 = DSM 44683]|uniref:SWIM-type domain-containing protein n=2 Tax=Corynebacterium halotolerans TaxID=225326 RepID=M1PA71_9CORY|nr:hypothetical protein A605_12825 [Corynebacterium halotolerans YIM 70093 = DSM 44683]
MSQPAFSPYTLQVLREYTSAETLQQGLELHSHRAAMLTGHMKVEDGIVYDFFVRNGPGKPGMVQTVVEIEPGSGVDSECTCPDLPCAHEVAAILYLVDKGWVKFAADGDAPQKTVPA